MCFLYELFGPDAPSLSRQLLAIQDVEVRDKLAVSELNKVLYQYASGDKPRRTCAPMVCVRLLETVQGEGNLKVSLLPIRVNLDQDTLEFLQDFFTELGDRTKESLKATQSSPTRSAGETRMEVPLHRPTSSSSPAKSSIVIPPSLETDLFDDDAATTAAQLADARLAASSTAAVDGRSHMHDSVVTLAGIFDESPAGEDRDDGHVSLERSGVGSDLLNGVRFKKQKAPLTVTTSHEIEKTRSHDSDDSRESTPVAAEDGGDDATQRHHTLSNTSPDGQIFLKTFDFSPSVTVRLDYQGKQRLNMDQGAMQALLMGLSQLHCTELTLKALHHRQGLLGIGSCAQYATNEWVADIRRNQLPQVVGSVGPISSLVQLAHGVRDLFVLPVDELRKGDEGRVVKGLQRGAESFGVSTTAAALDIVAKAVSLIQGAAEFAFEIVTPEYPPPRRSLGPAGGAMVRYNQPPRDLKGGVFMAYDTLRQGVNETASVLGETMAEERAKGRWPIRGLLRQATPTVLRPIVVTSRATAHLLGGLRSQLRPDTRREEEDKWRDTADQL